MLVKQNRTPKLLKQIRSPGLLYASRNLGPAKAIPGMQPIQPQLPPTDAAVIGQVLDTTSLEMQDEMLQADAFLVFAAADVCVSSWQRPIHRALK